MSAAAIISLVLQGLKIINWIVGALEKRGYINEGRRQELAEANAQIAKKGKFVRELRKRTMDMTDDELHNILVD